MDIDKSEVDVEFISDDMDLVDSEAGSPEEIVTSEGPGYNDTIAERIVSLEDQLAEMEDRLDAVKSEFNGQKSILEPLERQCERLCDAFEEAEGLVSLLLKISFALIDKNSIDISSSMKQVILRKLYNKAVLADTHLDYDCDKRGCGPLDNFPKSPRSLSALIGLHSYEHANSPSASQCKSQTQSTSCQVSTKVMTDSETNNLKFDPELAAEVVEGLSLINIEKHFEEIMKRFSQKKSNSLLLCDDDKVRENAVCNSNSKKQRICSDDKENKNDSDDDDTDDKYINEIPRNVEEANSNVLSIEEQLEVLKRENQQYREICRELDVRVNSALNYLKFHTSALEPLNVSWKPTFEDDAQSKGLLSLLLKVAVALFDKQLVKITPIMKDAIVRMLNKNSPGRCNNFEDANGYSVPASQESLQSWISMDGFFKNNPTPRPGSYGSFVKNVGKAGTPSDAVGPPSGNVKKRIKLMVCVPEKNEKIKSPTKSDGKLNDICDTEQGTLKDDIESEEELSAADYDC